MMLAHAIKAIDPEPKPSFEAKIFGQRHTNIKVANSKKRWKQAKPRINKEPSFLKRQLAKSQREKAVRTKASEKTNMPKGVWEETIGLSPPDAPSSALSPPKIKAYQLGEEELDP